MRDVANRSNIALKRFVDPCTIRERQPGVQGWRYEQWSSRTVLGVLEVLEVLEALGILEVAEMSEALQSSTCGAHLAITWTETPAVSSTDGAVRVHVEFAASPHIVPL